MDGDDQLNQFSRWLRTLAAQAGYDPDTRGGVAALARDAGTDRGQTSRAMRGELKPSIAYLRAWTNLFQSKGLQVTLRDMLIKSGTVEPDDLPAPGDTPPVAASIDLYAVARTFGIPDSRAHLFVSTVAALAQTFADDARPDSISGSQTGGHSSAER